MEDRQALIEFKNVTLGYGHKTVAENLSFNIYDNEFIGLVGPNGVGKTTVLRGLLGTLKPWKGEILRSYGKEMTFGYVPQRERLETIFPFTAFEVVLMGTYKKSGLWKRITISDYETALECLRCAGIESLKNVPFKDLSGGQKQRTLIARALSTQSKILVLDEPTNGMDLMSQKSILDLVRALHDDNGLTVVMVSHLLTEVSNYVKKIILMESKNIQIGTVDELLTDQNLSKLYGLPVYVDKVQGKNAIIVGDEHA